MKMEALDNLLGGAGRVRVMKLFLFNPEYIFATVEVAKRSKVPSSRVRKELNLLKKIGLIKQKNTIYNNRKVKGWYLNENFQLLNPLKLLLTSDRSFTSGGLSKRFRDSGRIKLIITSGAFIGHDDSRVDLLVVGDYLKPAKIDSVVKKIEADIGRELQYAICDTSNFIYRLNAYDKFVRDILDYPHEKVIDKIGLD